MTTIAFFRPGGGPAVLRAWRCASWIIGFLLVGSGFPAAAANIDNPLMAGRGGDVNFPISCGEQIQPRFDAALAALHAFWYGEAQEEFIAISQAAPDCAIAYWGIAMTHWNQIWAPPRPDNLKAGSEAIEKAEAAPQKSAREADYIDALSAFYRDTNKLDHRTRALAYSKKMEALAQKYPQDREAEIFYALSLLATADPLDKTYKNQLEAGSILERLSAEMPTHPGVGHYIIHAYDYPALADRALTAALKYETCVTIVPHAIHMPSHTFVLLGRWQDTINANVAAQEAERDRGIPEDRIHDLDYLVLAYLQLAQDKKAKETVDLARQIEEDMITRNRNTGLRDRHYNLAALEARWALERHEWETAANLPLRSSRYAYAEAIPHFARAVGLARLGRTDEAQAEVDQLRGLTKVLSDAKLPYWAGQVEIEQKIASGWIARGRGQDDEAVALMQAAAKQEDGLETHDTLNPGPIGMTADESLGMLLLELKRPADALQSFEASLHLAKNRLASYAGAASAAAAVNDVEHARKYYAKVIELAGGGDSDRPEVSDAKVYMKHTSN
jgi:hypothetical protein